MKLTFRKARKIILILMILGILAMILAGSFSEPGSALRRVLIWAGLICYLAACVILLIGFKCPACGAPFFKNALFLSECPVCGYKFSDFELGKKAPLPKGWSQPADSYDKLPPHK